MKLTLQRTDYLPDGIISTLISQEGYEFCYTLTHAFQDENGNCLPVVPPGTYICVRGTHQLEHGAPFETFEITGVTGHTKILFHKGNFNADSEGCELLGTEKGKINGKDAVLNSEQAFEEFISYLTGVNSFELEVLG